MSQRPWARPSLHRGWFPERSGMRDRPTYESQCNDDF